MTSDHDDRLHDHRKPLKRQQYNKYNDEAFEYIKPRHAAHVGGTFGVAPRACHERKRVSVDDDTERKQKKHRAN